jgi:predicted phage tail component-like protein
MARSFYFNGTDLSGASYGVTVLRHAVSFTAAPRVDRYMIGNRQGGFSQGGFLGARKLSFDCIVTGSSNDDLDDKLDAIRLLTDPRGGDKSIRFDHQNDRYYLGRLDGAIDFDYVGPNSARMTLEFMCANPSAYANSETTQSITVDASPDTNLVPATGTVAGTDYAYPVWKIQNTSGGALSSVRISNTTTGEVIESTYALPNGHYLRFDSSRQRLESSTDNTTWTNRMTNINSNYTRFPRLKPAVANSIEITGANGCALTVTYRARFL